MNIRLLAIVSLSAMLQGGLLAQDPGFKTDRPVSHAEPSKDDSSAATMHTNSMEVLDDTYALQIGDRISLRIVEDRDKVLALYIQESGDIQAPHLGLVKAAGRTCKQLAYGMKQELERAYFQHATVIVALDRRVHTQLPANQDAFTIYGQVLKQGKYELLPEEGLTISQAIVRAGGFAQFADKKNIKLIRRVGSKSVTIQINVADVMEKGKLEKDIPVHSNDVIIVKEKWLNF